MICMATDLYDPDLVGKDLNDQQIRSLIHSLQVAIKQLGSDIESIKSRVDRDKKDQWQYISDLGKKIEEIDQRCQK